MSVEVRELIIRTVVNSAEEKSSSERKDSSSSSKKSTIDGIEAALKLIKSKNER